MPFQCAFAPSFFLSAPMLSPTFSPTRFGSADTKTSTECGCSWSQITPNLLCQLLNLFLKLYFLHFHTWWQPKRSEIWSQRGWHYCFTSDLPIQPTHLMVDRPLPRANLLFRIRLLTEGKESVHPNRFTDQYGCVTLSADY